MSLPRIKVEGRSIYHTFNRCVDEARWMDTDYKKEKFREIMRKVEQYSGCHVLAYVIMDNHYHILLEQTDYEYIDNQEFMRRIACLYGDDKVYEIQSQYAKNKKLCGVEYADNIMKQLKLKHLKRMYDVSEFQRTLKQKYAQWYNTRFDRSGSYWGNTFKSVFVQDKPDALFMMATYIELNPIRKGYVKDVKDYRFSSYGEAYRGNKAAMINVIRTVGLYMEKEALVNLEELSKGQLYKLWLKYSSWYREHIFDRGEEVLDDNGNVVKLGFTHEQVEDVLNRRGRLSLAESMHCRVRYMTDGAVFGDEDFCEETFNKFRKQFSKARKTGARVMRKVSMGDCRTVRDLQKNAVRPPE